MTVAHRLMGSISAQQLRLGVVVAGGLGMVATGLAVSPAFASMSCSTYKTTIGTSYINMAYEQRAGAVNSGCSGSATLEVKLMEYHMWAPDSEVGKSTWSVSGSSYSRYVYGCRDEDGQFFGEQSGAGKQQQSDRRSFKHCQVQ